MVRKPSEKSNCWCDTPKIGQRRVETLVFIPVKKREKKALRLSEEVLDSSPAKARTVSRGKGASPRGWGDSVCENSSRGMKEV